VSAALVVLTLVAAAHDAPLAPYRAAVVIGQNVPDDEALALLRYADDDALRTHELFVEAGIDSVLLARLDDDTASLDEAPRDLDPPTSTAMNAALARLFERLRAAREEGRPTEFFFFFSGHGDLTDGEGSLVLDDGRLLRSSLTRDVLARSPADRNHVFIDACRSYFLAFAKGAGGTRERAPAGFTHDDDDTRAVRARTGYFLSTSSNDESHEWDGVQAGVFSHELRSGLRGAADVDADGTVSYREMQAFLMRANAGIAHARLRPRFLVVPPDDDMAGDGTVIAWPDDRDALTLDDDALGHVYLEGPLGQRYLDVPPSRGHVRRVVLPDARPLFLVDARSRDERTIVSDGGVRARDLSTTRARVASKGAEHRAFAALFTAPFGAVDVRAARFDAPIQTREGSPYVVPLFAASSALGVAGLLFGVTALGSTGAAAVVALAGLSASQVERVQRNELILALDAVALVSGILTVATLGGAGAALLTAYRLDDEGEDP